MFFLFVKACHPQPGIAYQGGYLHLGTSNTKDGQEAVTLMEKAFNARVLVTVKDDIVSWNAGFRIG